MERAGVGTAMLMLTALSVIAPATEWLGGSDGMVPTEPTTAVVSTMPSRSAEELRNVLSAYRDTGALQPDAVGTTRRIGGALRDPFAATPTTTPAIPAEPSIPAVELIGIIETPDGGIATLSIDGNVASLRVGESSTGVRVMKIAPPDAVVYEAVGRAMTARVQ